MKDTHPYQIGVGPNPQMNCYDVVVQFGNFKSNEAAQEFADALVELIKEHAGGWALRAQ